MQKTCASCGGEFEAKRANAKYCGDKCRQRGHRRPDKPAEQPSPLVVALPADPVAGSLAEATLAELERAGRGETAAGQAAMALARRVDHSHSETGTALAALVREHRAALAEAVRDAKQSADPLDELRARRERKRNAG